MRYDAQKIKEIAKRLGVSQATVEQYLHTRVAMLSGEAADVATPTPRATPAIRDLRVKTDRTAAA